MLNDSFHFGQTWTNDQGRPFGRGFNSYDGFTARAESGRFFAAAQAEYQRAPGADPYSLPVRQTIARLDGIPIPSAGPAGDVNRFRAIEAYAGVRLGDLQVSVGKQALWWGPTYDSPLSFGGNAEPTKNLKLSTVSPVRLGPIGVRGEFLLGKLGGQQYTWRPWFNAQKLSFKLTENLELGFTRWSIFWGVGHPITLGSLARNFTSTTSPEGPAGVGRTDPGDRKGGFDFRYRLPGVRNWLTLYSDSYSDDDPSPLAAPRRAAINPGLYLARVPGIAAPRPARRGPCHATDGPRHGRPVPLLQQPVPQRQHQLREPPRQSGRSRRPRAPGMAAVVVFGPRQARGRLPPVERSGKFLPGGSTQSDATLRGSVQLAAGWSAAATLQYERFWVPVLGGPRRNLSGWVQLTWEPALQLLH